MWQDQGRQQHGWFGNGTSPHDIKDAAGMFGQDGLPQRAQAVAYGSIGALPSKLQIRALQQRTREALSHLVFAMEAWSRDSGLSATVFARKFFDTSADDPVVDGIHTAAIDVKSAVTHADLRSASEKIAGAMQAVGLDRWPRFITAAADRAVKSSGELDSQDVAKPPLPGSGQASTYADSFVGRPTANGKTYRHEGYTAALLPKSRWQAVPLGTRVRITSQGRSVVVEVNDRGGGNGSLARVLDLSRAAMAYLQGLQPSDITDQNASTIHLDKIEIVPSSTPLGPVRSTK